MSSGFIFFIYASFVKKEVQDFGNAKMVETGFPTLMYATALSMQRLAVDIADDPDIRKVAGEARDAWEREGRGSGGPETEILRKKLLRLMRHKWGGITKGLQAKNVEFLFGSDSTSFLRLHEPFAFGDSRDYPVNLAGQVQQTGQPAKGFGTSKYYSGIRGAAPIYAENPETGEATLVGVVEVGQGFSTNVFDMKAIFEDPKLFKNQNQGEMGKVEVAVFLNEDHLTQNIRPVSLEPADRGNSGGRQICSVCFHSPGAKGHSRMQAISQVTG